MKADRPEVNSTVGGNCTLHAKLRQESCKLTGPRRAVLHVLEQQACPLTNKEIFRALPKGNCDLATVYRSVQMLERLGLVKRFHFGDGAARYALLEEGHAAHQHHLVCTCCTRIVEIGECIVRELEERVVSRSKFKAVTHRLEFFGICPACQK
ncbi:MAG: Fur family transcriptional regulator [Verrucomicrobiota bacterium]